VKSYETATIADLARGDGWSPIRKHFDVQSFGVNAWTASEAATEIIGEHDEQPSGHEELYVVIAGRATFTVDGEEVDAPTGTLVFVRDPAAKRRAVAVEPDTTVLTLGGQPGQAFRPRAWETNAEVFPMFAEERHEEVKQLLLANLDRYEDNGILLYNLACAEAQLGETDSALDHLAAALEQRPDLAENARDDSDLDPIRGDPGFPS
jgi:quercetin dioxygenase-like cupin family protein